jgi:hypothetical protein
MVTLTRGQFLQVAVSSARMGVCAIRAEDRNVQCWGQAHSLTTFMQGTSWDQIVLGASIVCGVSMQSQLKCGGGNGVNLKFPPDVLVS